MKERKLYLIHILFGVATKERLVSVAPRVLEAIEDVSNKDYLLSWHSLDRSAMAYVINTARTPQQIAVRFLSPSDTRLAELSGVPKHKIKDWGHAVLSHGDKISILGLNGECKEDGYPRLDGWLRSRQS